MSASYKCQWRSDVRQYYSWLPGGGDSRVKGQAELHMFPTHQDESYPQKCPERQDSAITSTASAAPRSLDSKYSQLCFPHRLLDLFETTSRQASPPNNLSVVQRLERNTIPQRHLTYITKVIIVCRHWSIGAG